MAFGGRRAGLAAAAPSPGRYPVAQRGASPTPARSPYRTRPRVVPGPTLRYSSPLSSPSFVRYHLDDLAALVSRERRLAVHLEELIPGDLLVADVIPAVWGDRHRERLVRR